MKIIKKISGLLVLLPMLAIGESKIAVIDPMQALLQAREVQERNVQLEKSIEPQGKRMLEIRQRLMEMEQRLQRDGMTMTESDRNQLLQQREGLAFEAQSLQQSVQQRVEADRQSLMQSMEPKLLRAIEAIVEERDIDVVLNAQAVVFIKPGMDITGEVTERLNKDR